MNAAVIRGDDEAARGSTTERLWSARDAWALAPESTYEPGGCLAMDAGYGFGLGPAQGVLTPYAGLTLGEESARTMRGGARCQIGPDLSIGIEATRSEPQGGLHQPVRVLHPENNGGVRASGGEGERPERTGPGAVSCANRPAGVSGVGNGTQRRHGGFPTAKSQPRDRDKLPAVTG